MGSSTDQYTNGSTIRVRYRTPRSTPDTSLSWAIHSVKHPENLAPSHDLDLIVEHSYQPFAVGVVCRVRPVLADPSSPGPTLPTECILKLYDRKQAQGFRECFNGGSHTQAKERAYQEFRAKPDFSEFDRELDDSSSDEGSDSSSDEGSDSSSDGGSVDPWAAAEKENDGEFELFIAQKCYHRWRNELETYEKLRHLQGSAIPTFLGAVEYNDPGDSQVVRGFLIEYIPAPTLEDFLTQAFKTRRNNNEILSVIRDAVAQVHLVGECGVINGDVRLSNILVRKRGE